MLGWPGLGIAVFVGWMHVGDLRYVYLCASCTCTYRCIQRLCVFTPSVGDCHANAASNTCHISVTFCHMLGAIRGSVEYDLEARKLKTLSLPQSAESCAIPQIIMHLQTKSLLLAALAGLASAVDPRSVTPSTAACRAPNRATGATKDISIGMWHFRSVSVPVEQTQRYSPRICGHKPAGRANFAHGSRMARFVARLAGSDRSVQGLARAPNLM